MNEEEMIKYKLLEYVRPDKMDFEEYDNIPRFGLIFSNKTMLLNKNDPLEEQVKGVLHEIFHLHPKYLNYTIKLWNGKKQRDEKKESEIEKLAQETYKNNPEIVDFIERMIKQAKRYSKNLEKKIRKIS